MRIRWRGLELPNRVVTDADVASSTYGRFTIEPFERGFGATVGNSLDGFCCPVWKGAR